MKRRVDRKLTERARELRNNATEAERTIWRVISRHRPKFTHQLSIEPYFADLACRKAKLIVELDGSQHIDSEHDAVRTAFLENEGWTIIRFWNSKVRDNPDGVAEAILLKAAECLGDPPPTPPFQGGGEQGGGASSKREEQRLSPRQSLVTLPE